MDKVSNVSEIFADSFYSEHHKRKVFRCVVVFKTGNDDVSFFSTMAKALGRQSLLNKKWEKYLSEEYAKQESKSRKT